jgi:hypothetical protein
MALLAISGFPLPLTLATKGTRMAGRRIPAITIKTIISRRVNP